MTLEFLPFAMEKCKHVRVPESCFSVIYKLEEEKLRQGNVEFSFLEQTYQALGHRFSTREIRWEI